MLSLRINTTQIPLSKDFALGFNFLMNVLNISESIDPSFTLPITVPNTEVVSQLIGYAQDPQSDFDLSQVFDDCAIMLDGNDFWLGAIEIGNANDDDVSFNFRFASGYIPTVNQKNKLRELFDDVNISIKGTSTNKYYITWNSTLPDSYSVDIGGTIYTEIVNQSSPDTPENYLIALVLKVQANASVTLVTFYPTTFQMEVVAVSPLLLAITAETTTEEDDGQGGTFENTVNRAITLVNDFAITSGDIGVKFELPTLYIPNLFGGAAPDYLGFANLHDGTKFYYKKPVKPSAMETSLIPCIKTSWMINYVFGLFGISVTGDYLNHSDLNNRIEFTPRGIEKEIFETDFSAGLDLQIPVSEFLPDITLSQWILSLKSEACMSITFDGVSQTASFNLLKNTLTATAYDDWTKYLVKFGNADQIKYNGVEIGYTMDNNDLRIKEHALKRDTFGVINDPVINLAALFAIVGDEPNAVRLVLSKNQFWKRTLILGDSTYAWLFYSYNMDAYYEGNEEIKIRSAYCPLVDSLQTFEGEWTSEMWLPYVDVTGYFPQLALNDNNFAPRFSIYRGMQADIEESTYPMASIGIYKADETIIDDALYTASPAVHPNSMVPTFYSNWLDLQVNQKEFTAFFDLPHFVIQNLKPTMKIRVRDVNFLATVHSGEIERRGLSLVQTKLTRIL
jgi:hypothetical protein